MDSSLFHTPQAFTNVLARLVMGSAGIVETKLCAETLLNLPICHSCTLLKWITHNMSFGVRPNNKSMETRFRIQPDIEPQMPVHPSVRFLPYP